MDAHGDKEEEGEGADEKGGVEEESDNLHGGALSRENYASRKLITLSEF